ncbi:cyanophycin synthetase [Mucilaginibacter sp. HD30]
MEIEKINVMRGPNLWSSVHHQLIVLKLKQDNTAHLQEVTTDLTNRLKAMNLPLAAVTPDTGLPALAGHLAIALQQIAGMEHPSATDMTVIVDEGPRVIFIYEVETAGIYAGKAAIKIINDLLNGIIPQIMEDIIQLKRLNGGERLGPSTKSIVDAAKIRHIPVTRLDDSSLVMLGHGVNQRLIRTAVASSTSAIAVEAAQDKELTKRILGDNYVPIPRGVVISDLEELVSAIEELGFPLVIKPTDGNHGRGITTNIQTQAEAVKAFQLAAQISDDVIVETHIHGHDFRFLVINYKLVAAAKRTPAMVTGDGKSTIAQLVEQTNKDPRRGSGHEQVLTAIELDEDSLVILASQQLTPENILTKDRTVYLKSTANLSTGGTAEDVTDLVHPDNKALAERIARLMGLDICGIDIITDTVTVPITDANGAVLEVNAGPGLRMHLAPSKGTSRDVGGPIVNMLFPQGRPSRIPLVAVTGTNGKTTVTRTIAHLAQQAGYNTGYTTTDGIYIKNRMILSGDCSGPQSARVVLRDPLVDFAVLECARGGMLRSGLGFDECGVAIVTNVSADHLGLDGVETLEQLARVKSIVPKSVNQDGFAILNADDELVYSMKKQLTSKVALFSINPENPYLQNHISDGGMAACIQDNWFVLYTAGRRQNIVPVADVPLTFRGTADCMIKNVLPAILATCIYEMPIEQIKAGLLSFIPSPENTPGRMNEFDFDHFRLMIDYAHNEGGYKELKSYASKVKAGIKTAIIAATGDRRDEDIRNMGSLAAEIFDELIIRHDKDRRGRTNDQITSLLKEGITLVKPEMQITVISDEMEAIDYAIRRAQKDAWIFVNTDDVPGSLAFVKHLHQDHLHLKHNIAV